MKLLLGLIFILSSLQIVYSQNATIRGFVYNSADGEPMPFEKVRLLNMDSSTVSGGLTDVNGFYSIAKINKGEYLVKVQIGSYTTQVRPISINAIDGITNYTFNMEKLENVIELDVMNASADAIRKKTQILVSEIRLDKKGLERIPSVGGENDIVGAFSVTPGVITTGDQGGQLYVRGGTPIQNKILLDGMTIYNPFHSIGFFSIFETELVQSTSIFTGGFDAKYGGRISSIMDITYRDGNKKKFGGKISASPFLAKVALEGPLSRTKDGKESAGSYIFSAKHSLLDYTSESLYTRVNDGEGMPFSFTDLYGKLTFKGKGGSKFSGFGLHNIDQVNYDIANINWTQVEEDLISYLYQVVRQYSLKVT